MSEELLIQREGGVVTFALSRPKAANALSISLLHALQQELEKYQYDQTIRALVLRGEGDKVFCAGADLKERKRMSETEVKKTVSLIRETVDKLERFPKPVIAAMNGSALGGGLEVALACDIRVASIEGKYGLPETSLAIIPGAGGTQRLARLIGLGKAKELIFTAKQVDGETAKAIGLAEYAEPTSEVIKKAREIAEEIENNGPIALESAKKAINLGYETALATGLMIEQQAYAATIQTKDRLEGLQAFAEKRQPLYEGK